MYCYDELKLRYHKNLKLFSIRIKELSEPIVLRKKGAGFLLFLKAFSWETDLWVTLGDFTVKKRKIGKGNLYLTENRLSWNEMCCAADHNNYMCHIIRTSIKQLLTKYQIFRKLPQIPHIHINRYFFKYICNLLDQLLHPYKFHGRDMSRILFFIFASCEQLSMLKSLSLYTVQYTFFYYCLNMLPKHMIFVICTLNFL